MRERAQRSNRRNLCYFNMLKLIAINPSEQNKKFSSFGKHFIKPIPALFQLSAVV
jgi:hypothetical protein